MPLKKFFFDPGYAALGVLAEDFDQDGETYFAYNCFHPDFGRFLQESFVYLQMTNQFKTNSLLSPAKAACLQIVNIREGWYRS